MEVGDLIIVGGWGRQACVRQRHLRLLVRVISKHKTQQQSRHHLKQSHVSLV